MPCPVCDKEFEDSFLLDIHVSSHFDGEDAEETAENEVQTEYRNRKILLSNSREDDASMRKTDEVHEASDKEIEGAVASTSPPSNVEHLKTNSSEALPTDTERPHLWLNLRPHPHLLDEGSSRTVDPLQPLRGEADLTLCLPCDHFATYGRYRGYACGFMNLQLILSSVMQHDSFKDVIFMGKDWIPSVCKLQELIEEAWEAGFDALGSYQFGGHLQNSRRWIGATEVAALFSSLSINCSLVEFHTLGPAGYQQQLYEWLICHFHNSQSPMFPIYIQHHGHSRCIVGIDEHEQQILLLDPSWPTKTIRNLVNSGNCQSIRAKLSHPIESFFEEQYQLVVIHDVMETEAQFENAKILENIYHRIN